MKSGILTFLCLFISIVLFAQLDASLMQQPDVSSDKICFVYGDDIWISDKKGGIAIRLSSPAGREFYPRFSPDGNSIAYTANYNGNNDVYVIPIGGGIPTRLTYHGMSDRVQGWSPDGSKVIFSSSRESGRQRFSQFYMVNANGGQPEKLPIPYGEYCSMSPDGKKMAYTDRSRVNRNWKRYRGGTAPDITVFDLESYESEFITNNSANDELPMWIGNSIYYMSDRGPAKHNNIWKYDIASKEHKQLTNFDNYDITFPENGPEDIIFEAGGELYLFNLQIEESTKINIEVITDQTAMVPELKNVGSMIQSYGISPDGKRVIIQARGELFDVPAEKGYIANLSNSSGVAERFPEWSPDGKSIAYWSDESGEYQLVVMNTADKTKSVKTKFTSGFRYNLFWSPDSKKIVFVDQSMNINFIDLNSGTVTSFDKGKYMLEGGLRGFTASWSPDSKWIAYSKSADNPSTSAVFVYNIETKKVSQLTSGFYNDSRPVFSSDGKYLFFPTNRNFEPLYSDMDNTWIYPNATHIAVATLNENVESLLDVENDKVEMNSADSDSEDTENKTTTIQVEGFEERVELLDIKPGNAGSLTAVDGKLLFMRFPNTGENDESKSSLNYYDFEKKEVKTIIADVNNYEVSANEKKVLIRQKMNLAVVDIAENQKMDKPLATQNLMMEVVPKLEWNQIFNDVWRIERDYFYDPNMHGVDWNAMKSKYGKLVEIASTRNDVNIIIGDLIAELNASHTYNGGGDSEKPKSLKVGYLGADFSVENGYFRIKKIIKGAPWDVEDRSPLLKPGLNVKEGYFIIAINDTKPDVSKPISAALQGLAGQTIKLTINSSASTKNSRDIYLKTMDSETRLRHLAWINENRKRVDEASNGKLAYIYVRSTGIDGQSELVRQYFGQMHKEGMIIDERFNSGGQIPDRFIELLDRDPLAFWAVRDGEDWSWPPSGNFGPKAMLINGFSGSGGDAFPDYFRKRGLGPLIGTRTWGGLIGISGAPGLIDNGGVTSPTFRMYDPNGEWFKEGHGVDPDIEVKEDFEKLAKGIDVQLEKAIEEVMKKLNSGDTFKKPPRPEYETR